MHKRGEPRDRSIWVKSVRLAAGGTAAAAAWTLRDAPCAPAVAEVQPASIEFEILRKALRGRRCLFLRRAANGVHIVSVPSQPTCGWRLYCTVYLRACCFRGSGRSARVLGEAHGAVGNPSSAPAANLGNHQQTLNKRDWRGVF